MNRDVRIGSLDHLTASRHDDERGARTLCGIYIAGTPVARSSAGACEACETLRPCDECGHTGPEHLWAPALEAVSPDAAAYVYAEATCWAENICRGCNPTRYATARSLLPDAPAGAGHAVEADRG